MIHAVLVVAALLAPWLAAYVAVGLLAGPLLLIAAHRHGIAVSPIADAPRAIGAWPLVGAWLLVMAAREN